MKEKRGGAHSHLDLVTNFSAVFLSKARFKTGEEIDGSELGEQWSNR